MATIDNGNFEDWIIVVYIFSQKKSQTVNHNHMTNTFETLWCLLFWSHITDNSRLTDDELWYIFFSKKILTANHNHMANNFERLWLVILHISFQSYDWELKPHLLLLHILFKENFHHGPQPYIVSKENLDHYPHHNRNCKPRKTPQNYYYWTYKLPINNIPWTESSLTLSYHNDRHCCWNSRTSSLPILTESMAD